MNEIAPELSVDSVTGIDVSLPVAGPGARSFAFLIDWHIRLVLALAWYALGAFIYNRGLSIAAPLTNDAAWFGAVVTPALAIYFLYHYAVELAMRGSTPGKRIAGIRIVAHDGSAPGAGALLVRNVFRLIDTLPVLYCVGLVAVIATREHLRVGDMAAGTLLVYERDAAHLPPAAEAPRLDAQASELVAELLERWPTLAPDARLQLGRQLLARYGGGAAAADESALRGALSLLLHGSAGGPP
ncbi:MAG TPA: RDD family protein [Steroidobacteraceae bacterium]|nr:RDD family protein [Steroidobacteraceae bacterium]